MSRIRIFETPCPRCGAANSVSWTVRDEEDYTIKCDGCQATFTHEEWRRIANEEMSAPYYRTTRRRKPTK
jgi:transcription elongation factor Elf1